MARIPLPSRETLEDEAHVARWDRAAERGPVLNVTRMFFVNPAIETNAIQVWRACGLDGRKREIVILRAAFQKRSTYEWHQHVRIARGEGLSDAEINAVRNWRESSLFDGDERALLAYVDELAANPRPSDESLAAIRNGRSDAEIFGITYLVTLYFQLAHMMAAFDLETEVPFVGWEVG